MQNLLVQGCLGCRVCVCFQGRRVDTVNGTDLSRQHRMSVNDKTFAIKAHVDDPRHAILLLRGTKQGKSLLRDGEDLVDVQVHDLWNNNGQ